MTANLLLLLFLVVFSQGYGDREFKLSLSATFRQTSEIVFGVGQGACARLASVLLPESPNPLAPQTFFHIRTFIPAYVAAASAQAKKLRSVSSISYVPNFNLLQRFSL